MDNRRYNIMMLEAQAEAARIMQDFQRQFYARQIQNAERQLQMFDALQQVTAAPEPIPTPEEVSPEIAMPTFEEEDNG